MKLKLNLFTDPQSELLIQSAMLAPRFSSKISLYGAVEVVPSVEAKSQCRSYLVIEGCQELIEVKICSGSKEERYSLKDLAFDICKICEIARRLSKAFVRLNIGSGCNGSE